MPTPAVLTWKKIREWCRAPDDHPHHYDGWFWTAFYATYGLQTRRELVEQALALAALHRKHPDCSVERGMYYCYCHMDPRLLGLTSNAIWEGNPSVTAWHHFPLVRAYLLSLLVGDDESAARYLTEFGEWRQSRVEEYDIALGIGDIARAHALARHIVDKHYQQVYFFCRNHVNDPDLLERARDGLMKDTNLLRAPWCARTTNDTEFLERIAAVRSAA